MNTYRMYALDATNALEPAVHITYLRAEKYANAWSGSRAALDADKAGKAVKLYADPECTVPATIKPGERVTCVRIDDIRPRNVKLDKAALQAILADAKASDADKLEAMKALLG